MKTIAFICITLLSTIASVAEIYAASQILSGNVSDSFKWFWIGFLLGIVALVFAYLNSKDSKGQMPEQAFNEKKQSPDNEMNTFNFDIEIRIKLKL